MLKYFVIEKKIDFMLINLSTRIIHKEQKKINAKIWIPAVRISLRRSMDSGTSCFSLHRTPVQSARMWLLFCVAKHGVMTLGERWKNHCQSPRLSWTLLSIWDHILKEDDYEKNKLKVTVKFLLSHNIMK